MANIIDYMEWRGDLSFSQSRFNEVDNLIFSVLSYVDFSDILDDTYKDSISIQMAARLYFDKHSDDLNINPLTTIRNAPAVLQKMAKCRRFANLRLTNYVNYIDIKSQVQFSAITIILDLEHAYVSFRGTDDTFIGWKEDFNMAFMDTVPAQKEAAIYLERISDEWEGKMILGGHSKGGNLAIYAGIYCADDVKERISCIYTNDGPGFRKEIVRSRRYKDMSPKIKSIVPESSIVGMMFYNSGEYKVVKSSKKGFMQHDPMTWEVLGNEFVCVENRSSASILMDKALTSWLEGLDVKKREEFIDALFGLFESSNVKTLTELSEQGMKILPTVIKSYFTLDEQTRKMMLEIVRALIQSADGILKNNAIDAKQEVSIASTDVKNI